MHLNLLNLKDLDNFDNMTVKNTAYIKDVKVLFKRRENFLNFPTFSEFFLSVFCNNGIVVFYAVS